MIEVQVLVTGNLVQFRISYQKWSLTSRGFTDGVNRFSVPKNIKRISEGYIYKNFQLRLSAFGVRHLIVMGGSR